MATLGRALRRRRGRCRLHGHQRRARPEGGRAPSDMATALYVQFDPQRQPLLASGARGRMFHVSRFVRLRSVPNRIAQGQRGRTCFAFPSEEDGNQTQEGTRRGKPQCSPLTPPILFALLPRFCGVLARSSKNDGSFVFRVFAGLLPPSGGGGVKWLRGWLEKMLTLDYLTYLVSTSSVWNLVSTSRKAIGLRVHGRMDPQPNFLGHYPPFCR
jgi:hypothetical protein